MILKKDPIKSFFGLFKWGWFKFAKCIFGVFLSSLAVNLFVVPNHLYTGGFLGLSQLIRTFLIETFKISAPIDISSLIYYAFNIPLFLLAYKRISKTFLLRTVFTVTLNALFLMLIPIPKVPIVDDLMVNVLIGGVLDGVGIGMILSTYASMGGTDIIGIAIGKMNNKVTVGYIGLLFNVFVYSICGLRYGITIMVYSLLFAIFESFSIDKNHFQSICSEAFIFTKEEPTEMINFIIKELNRDATYWEADAHP